MVTARDDGALATLAPRLLGAELLAAPRRAGRRGAATLPIPQQVGRKSAIIACLHTSILQNARKPQNPPVAFDRLPVICMGPPVICMGEFDQSLNEPDSSDPARVGSSARRRACIRCVDLVQCPGCVL